MHHVRPAGNNNLFRTDRLSLHGPLETNTEPLGLAASSAQPALEVYIEKCVAINPGVRREAGPVGDAEGGPGCFASTPVRVRETAASPVHLHLRGE